MSDTGSSPALGPDFPAESASGSFGEQPEEAAPDAPAASGGKGRPSRPPAGRRGGVSPGPDKKRHSFQSLRDQVDNRAGSTHVPASDAFRKSKLFKAVNHRDRGGTLMPGTDQDYMLLAEVKVDLRGLNDDQVDALRTVESKHIETTSELQRVADAYNTKAGEYSDVVDILKQKEKKIEELRSGEADDVRHFRDKQSSAYEDLLRGNEALNETLRLQRQRNDQIVKEKSALDTEHSLVKIKAEEAEKETERCKEEAEDALEKLGVARNEVDSLEEENDLLKEEAVELKEEADRAVKGEQVAKDELESFRGKTLAILEQQKEQVAEATEKMIKAREELQEQKEENENLEARFKSLQLKNEELELENSRVREDLDRVREELETLKNQQQGMVIELSSFKEIHATDVDRMQDLEKQLHNQKSNVQNDLDAVADELRHQAGKLLIANEELLAAVEGTPIDDEEASRRAIELEKQIPDADFATEVDRTAVLSGTVADTVQSLRDDLANLAGDLELLELEMQEAEDRAAIAEEETNALTTLLADVTKDSADVVAAQLRDKAATAAAAAEQDRTALSEESERQGIATLAYAELLGQSAQQEAKALAAVLAANHNALTDLLQQEQDARLAIEDEALNTEELLKGLMAGDAAQIARDEALNRLEKDMLANVDEEEERLRRAIEDEEEEMRNNLQETNEAMKKLTDAQDAALKAAADAITTGRDMAIADVQDREEELRRQIEEEEAEMWQKLQEAGDTAARLAHKEGLLSALSSELVENAHDDEEDARRSIEDEEEEARNLLHLAHVGAKDLLAQNEQERDVTTKARLADQERALSDVEDQEAETRKNLEDEEEDAWNMLDNMHQDLAALLKDKEDTIGSSEQALLASQEQAVSNLEEQEAELRKQIESEQDAARDFLNDICATDKERAENKDALGGVCQDAIDSCEMEEADGRRALEDEEEATRDQLLLAHQDIAALLKDKEDTVGSSEQALLASQEQAVSNLEEQEAELRKQIESEQDAARDFLDDICATDKERAENKDALGGVCQDAIDSCEMEEADGRRALEDEEEAARDQLFLAHQDIAALLKDKEDTIGSSEQALLASQEQAVSNLEEQEAELRRQIESEQDAARDFLDDICATDKERAENKDALGGVCQDAIDSCEMEEADGRRALEDEEEAERQLMDSALENLLHLSDTQNRTLDRIFNDNTSNLLDDEETRRKLIEKEEEDAQDKLAMFLSSSGAALQTDAKNRDYISLDNEEDMSRRDSENEERKERENLFKDATDACAVIVLTETEAKWRQHIEEDEEEARAMLAKFMGSEQEIGQTLLDRNFSAATSDVQEAEARERRAIEEDSDDFFATLPERLQTLEQVQNSADQARLDNSDMLSRALWELEKDEFEKRKSIEDDASSLMKMIPLMEKDLRNEMSSKQRLQNTHAVENECDSERDAIVKDEEDEASKMFDSFKKFAKDQQEKQDNVQEEETAARHKIAKEEDTAFNDLRNQLWNELLQSMIEEEEAEKMNHLLAMEDANDSAAAKITDAHDLVDLAQLENDETRRRSEVCDEEAREALLLAREFEKGKAFAMSQDAVAVQRDEHNDRRAVQAEEATALNKLLTNNAEPCERSAIQAEEERLAKQLHLINDTLNLFNTTANQLAQQERDGVGSDEAATRHEMRSIEDLQWQNLLSSADASRRAAEEKGNAAERGDFEHAEADVRAKQQEQFLKNRASLMDMFLTDTEDMLKGEEQKKRDKIKKDERHDFNELFDNLAQDRTNILRNQQQLATDIDALQRQETAERDELKDFLDTQLAMLADDIEEGHFAAQEAERTRRREDAEREAARQKQERERLAAERARVEAERRRRHTAYMGLEISEGIVVGRTANCAGEKITREGVPYDLEGVKVFDVHRQGPAYLAGINQDDVVTHFNGAHVTNLMDFRKATKLTKPGDTVVLTVYRPNAGMCDVEIKSEVVDEEEFEPGSRRTLGYKVPVLSRTSYHPE